MDFWEKEDARQTLANIEPPGSGVARDVANETGIDDLAPEMAALVVRHSDRYMWPIVGRVSRRWRDLVAHEWKRVCNSAPRPSISKSRERQARRYVKTLVHNRERRLVEWVHENESILFTSALCTAAAKTGDEDLFAWLCDKGCVPTPKAVNGAACHGQLHMLEQMHRGGYPIDPRAYVGAAQNGRVDVFEWLRSHGTEPLDPRCVVAAARNGHLAALEWLRKNGCPWNATASAAAIAGGHLNVLE